jgi:hypothetical protein
VYQCTSPLLRNCHGLVPIRTLTFFTLFSRRREKCKWLCFLLLSADFHRFFTIFRKTFRVPMHRLSHLCPSLVPPISWDAEVIEKRAFSPLFCDCPADFLQSSFGMEGGNPSGSEGVDFANFYTLPNGHHPARRCCGGDPGGRVSAFAANLLKFSKSALYPRARRPASEEDSSGRYFRKYQSTRNS